MQIERMPLAQTRRFGALEYEDTSILTFPHGLPGFEGCTRFTVVERREFAPIVFLQSLEKWDLCFFAAPIAAIDSSYDPAISREDMERLGGPETSSSDLLFLALLCAPENGPLSANLLAPVVVNVRLHVAVQAVRADLRYSHRHPIHPLPVPVQQPVEEMEEQPCW